MSTYRYPPVDGEFSRDGAFETELEWEEEGSGATPPPIDGESYVAADRGPAPAYESAGYESAGYESAGYESAGYESTADAEWEQEADYEDEFEVEFDFLAEYEARSSGEAEDFANPIRRIYPDAELMAHLAHEARIAPHDREAEALIGAIVPLAGRLVPRAATVLRPMAPVLIRGLASVVRQLRRDPATRALTDTVPVILQRTAQSIADQVIDNGQSLTSPMVLDTLARMTTEILANPSARSGAVRAVRAFDRDAHRSTSAIAARPPVPARVRPGSRQRTVQARRSANAGRPRARRV